MKTQELITELKNSKLVAECPCGESFRLSDAILFDGKGKVPAEAEELRKGLFDALKEREAELKKRKVSADVGAEKKAIEVGIGKIIEKIIPIYADFKIPIGDCRALFEPIDMIAFRGMTEGKPESIEFLEIKTGKSPLSKHQRMIRDAIADGNVGYKEV